MAVWREMQPDLAVALDALADVMFKTEDAYDLYAAMQWVEAVAVANVLHSAGETRIAADVVTRWVDANGTETELDDFVTPAELLSIYGVCAGE